MYYILLACESLIELSCSSFVLFSVDLDAAVHPSPLQEISEEEAVQIHVPSALPPESSTLRPYVDKSETLSKLVQLGVSHVLSKLCWIILDLSNPLVILQVSTSGN